MTLRCQHNDNQSLLCCYRGLATRRHLVVNALTTRFQRIENGPEWVVKAVKTVFNIPSASPLLRSPSQDEMERPTFETLQWKLEDFFLQPLSEYNEASVLH